MLVPSHNTSCKPEHLTAGAGFEVQISTVAAAARCENQCYSKATELHKLALIQARRRFNRSKPRWTTHSRAGGGAMP